VLPSPGEKVKTIIGIIPEEFRASSAKWTKKQPTV